MSALSFENVSFSYADGEPVLNGASFEIEPGEFVALVGDNGSGKSTIAKMTDAFLLPSSGDVLVFGKDTADVAKMGNDALLELRCDIGFVQQNPDNQFVASRVIDEVAFGPSGLGIPKEDVIQRATGALAQVGAEDLRNRDVNTLSGGQKQRVAIADALAMVPELFIFDEPTSMLDEAGTMEVMRTINALHKSGATILLITHSAQEAVHADRALKVEMGKITESPDLLKEEEAAFAGVREYAEMLHENSNRPEIGDALINVRDVAFAYDDKDDIASGLMGVKSERHVVFEDLNMQIREHELLCIAGPNGCGKSTLASLLNGLLRPTKGSIEVYGIPTNSKHGANAARRRVGVCFQYPERNFFCQTVLDEAAFGPKNTGLSKTDAENAAKAALRDVGLEGDDLLKASPFDLSGGMQRKVALASILSMRPDVLVMDEPCAGLDVAAHAEFVRLMLNLKAKGQTIIMITHDARDREILADEVAFLC